MRGARGPVFEAGAKADDAHGQVVEDRAVADELEWTQAREGADRIAERDEPGLGEAGGDTDHVLLRDADVVEAFGVSLAKRLQHREAKIAGEQHDPLVLPGDVAQGVHKGPPHSLNASISANAVAYSSSDIGR